MAERLSATCLLLAFGPGHTAPQTFNTALPVAKGEFVFREQLFRHRASDDPSAADRDLEVLGSVSVLGVGVSRNLVLFGVVPYSHKTLDLSTAAGDLRRKHHRPGGRPGIRALYALPEKRPGTHIPHCTLPRHGIAHRR